MSQSDLQVDRQYPVGRHVRSAHFGVAERIALLDRLAAQPAALADAVRGLSDRQLDQPYRDGGWSSRQIAHHLADSHMNAYIRVKLALSEHEPTIKPYDQNAWANMADVRVVPVDVSLSLFDSVHRRLLAILRDLDDSAFSRRLLHPENGPMTIDSVVGLYAWHGDHHIAQIRALRERESW